MRKSIGGYKRQRSEPGGISGVKNTTHVPLDVARSRYYESASRILATFSEAYQSYQNSVADIEVPSSYREQVERSREIWGFFGGKYSDPIVSAVMDTMVSTAVSFGSENLFKGIAADHPARRVLDHWCANVNGGNPTLTKGLDAARDQMHRLRYADGGVVCAWSVSDTFKTDDGIVYQAPNYLAMLPRIMFDMRGSADFGGFELKYRTDIEENTTGSKDEISIHEKAGMVNDFLGDKRYQLIDRNRIESVQKYPVPYLAERNLISICARIRAMQRGDYRTVARLIKALLLVTRGSDEWVSEFEWNPTEADFSGIVDTLKQKESGDVNVLGADYTTKAEWVQPDVQALLAREKYDQDNYERLAALGILEIEGTGQRRRWAFNPKPLIMELRHSMLADMRFVEGRLFPEIWKANTALFEGVPPANFQHKPPTIFWDDVEKQMLSKMFEYGVLGVGSFLEWGLGYGADADAEYHRRLYEKDAGFDEVFKPHVMYTQSFRDEEQKRPKEKEQEEDEEETEESLLAAQEKPLLDMYDDLRRQVREVTESDMEVEGKKKTMQAAVVVVFSAMADNIVSRLRVFYVNQGGTRHLDKFNPYIEKQGERIEAFGNDLLQGSKSGMKGLYSLVVLPIADIGVALDRIFDSYSHRLSLYEQEPFKVAAESARAAQGIDAGMKYAVRHAAFLPNTCEECIALHGEIITIDRIFAGGWDHPHGQCYWSYHKNTALAALEVEEMLTIKEMNYIYAAVDEAEETIFVDLHE